MVHHVIFDSLLIIIYILQISHILYLRQKTQTKHHLYETNNP